MDTGYGEPGGGSLHPGGSPIEDIACVHASRVDLAIAAHAPRTCSPWGACAVRRQSSSTQRQRAYHGKRRSRPWRVHTPCKGSLAVREGGACWLVRWRIAVIAVPVASTTFSYCQTSFA